jgi:hypothetical protein
MLTHARDDRLRKHAIRLSRAGERDCGEISDHHQKGSASDVIVVLIELKCESDRGVARRKRMSRR